VKDLPGRRSRAAAREAEKVKKATAMSLVVARGTIALSTVAVLVSTWLAIYTVRELALYGGQRIGRWFRAAF
jgi:hypothetical protein